MGEPARGRWLEPRLLTGRPLLAGEARAEALVLDQPLSFWGGLDPGTGLIVERRHPQHGRSVAGLVLAMSGGRGSSSSSSVLAEALRNGCGPAGIVLATADEIVLLGALVARLLYGLECPVVELAGSDLRHIRSGDLVAISGEGRLEITGARAVT